MNQVQGLCILLANRVVRQNQAINVVAEALLKSILAPHDLPHRPTMSLLFLDLTSVGQADRVRSLAENFVCDDGTDLLIDVDLSKYRDSDIHFSDSYMGLWSYQQLVQMRPHSILVFSQVEQAHISVFSALLSVLDQDMGKSKVLAQLVRHADPYDSSIEVMQQKKSGFRSELLNQIDEIVCFNPFSGEQLRKVARLSMRDGPQLVNGRPLELPAVILHLFSAASDCICSVQLVIQ
ncbi:chaperone protein ClpB1-like [Rhododendron vialii]|uniref:chaperone protein ClpB1-like n=1 Tax=Rhododendron vialii TaxID=182163 RepID=UPI00265E9EBA|nr:chaperone protein ClpB1-like [Rhododendron vialii]